ncbi:MAG TPA: GntR family transcriptional regulator [Acidimicrobiia bacterium]|nr:GntR family transcriptional regulator [Acidimicrobiia bacterium]
MSDPAFAKPTSEAIYERLRDQICLLDLPPGTPLREQALAKEFGVSRTPIREALTMLRVDGLVTPRDGGGSSVSVVDLKSLRDVYALRIKLAELIADFMVAPVPAGVLEDLRQLRTEVEAAAPTHDARLLGTLYNRLHAASLSTVANEPLRVISDRLFRQTSRIWIELLPEMDWDEEVQIFLEEIDHTLEALEGGSARYMAEIRAKHMSMLLSRFNAYLTRPLI